MSGEEKRDEKEFLGVVTAGSLTKGLRVRVQQGATLETVQAGQFLVIEGQAVNYFGLITDIELGTTNDDILMDPPEPTDSALVFEVMRGVNTFGDVLVTPSLTLTAQGLRPVKSIPGHFSRVYIAQENDFTQVFGTEDFKRQFFAIGQPLDMDIDVCLNLARIAERSNGIFGKSGTGKSFFTRLLISGMIKSNACVNLIFDMHNEYGWESSSEGEGGSLRVKGLRQLFGPRVLVYTIDRESARQRGVSVDGELRIGLNQIDVEDIQLIAEQLELSTAAIDNAYLIQDYYKDDWINKIFELELDQIAQDTKANEQSLGALRRKLKRIERLPFIKPREANASLDDLIMALQSGKHIVLEFGGNQDLLAYMLVANVLTRRIRESWVKKVDHYMRTKNESDLPPQLMITIEEAHKFLSPQVASFTTFGKIARELRKYRVTLLVVDQRPSSIDPEVMSQIGTRITALLNDDKDIDAVFTGVSGGANLRTILASLDSKQQALILGHAVPMAVVVRTRAFDETFYAAMQNGPGPSAPHGRDKDEALQAFGDASSTKKELGKRAIDELFGD